MLQNLSLTAGAQGVGPGLAPPRLCPMMREGAWTVENRLSVPSWAKGLHDAVHTLPRSSYHHPPGRCL